MHRYGVSIVIDFAIEIRSQIENIFYDEHYDWMDAEERHLYLLLLQILPQERIDNHFAIDGCFGSFYVINFLKKYTLDEKYKMNQYVRMILPFFHKEFKHNNIVNLGFGTLNIDADNTYKKYFADSEAKENFLGTSSIPKRKQNKFGK